MSAAKDSDLFITGIEFDRRNYKDVDLLVNVRKEHAKIKEVINSFQQKVDKLIDKQRQEYLLAYESHVQDVQKELHGLREKVFEIANDDTKNERTEKLKNDLKFFKTEALQLETASEELRTGMARLVQQIYSAEKSRDWMLKRLRQAKKKNNELQKEKSALIEEFSVASNSQSFSSGNYTIELNRNNGTSSNNKTSKKIERNLKNCASVERQVHLPQIYPKSSSNQHSLPNVIPSSQFRSSQELKVYSSGQDDPTQLIELRSSINEVREFLRQCRDSLHKRPWNKVYVREKTTLLQSCRELIDSPSVYNAQQVLPFACELATIKEVYEILSDLLMNQPERSDSPANRARTPKAFPSSPYIDPKLLSWEPKN